MSIDIYEDTDLHIDIDSHLYSGIDGFQIAYGTTNKEAFGKALKKQSRIKRKLDSIHEKRSLDKQIDSFSEYWDF